MTTQVPNISFHHFKVKTLYPLSSFFPFHARFYKESFTGTQPHPLFMYHIWLVLCYNGRVELLQQRFYGLPRQKYLLSGPL